MDIYKQKYEAALDNFKKIKASNKDNKELVDFIEYEYPELKESEGEKIRKEMIDFMSSQLKSLMPPCPSNETLKTWIAWLEKQDERKHFGSKEDMKKINKTIWLIENYASHGHIKELREEAVNWLKSLKERMKGQ